MSLRFGLARWKKGKPNPFGPAGQISDIMDKVNEAFSYMDEMAGCVEETRREQFRKRCHDNREAVQDFLEQMFYRRRAETATHFKVVAEADAQGLAFIIHQDSYFVHDSFDGSFWTEDADKYPGMPVLSRLSKQPVDTGWVGFHMAPNEVVKMWNLRSK